MLGKGAVAFGEPSKSCGFTKAAASQLQDAEKRGRTKKPVWRGRCDLIVEIVHCSLSNQGLGTLLRLPHLLPLDFGFPFIFFFLKGSPDDMCLRTAPSNPFQAPWVHPYLESRAGWKDRGASVTVRKWRGHWEKGGRRKGNLSRKWWQRVSVSQGDRQVTVCREAVEHRAVSSLLGLF